MSDKPKEIEIDAPEIEAKIQEVIDELLKAREDARVKYGQLKQSAFERVEDRGLMQPAPMYAEYIKIEACQSALPSSDCKIITQIVLEAMRRGFNEKIKALQAEQETAGIPKKKRTKKTDK